MVRHLYLHIPFCHHICPYCAFYKHKPGRLASGHFVSAILEHARQSADQYPSELETIYFGGGTPSLLGPVHLERLIRGLAEQFDVSKLKEWSLEANPATFDLEKAKLLYGLGVNRISLGVQSFSASTLTTLGRDHSPDDAIEAFHTLRTAGFDQVSIDLMFSIPGQDLHSWGEDIATAISLKPDHLSCYNLTYEEDTDFLRRHKTGELDSSEDRDASLFYHAMTELEGSGFQQYEISNYSLAGCESIHNRAYWMGHDFIGLGPSAVSTVDGQRWAAMADTEGYINRLKESGDVRTAEEEITPEKRRIESVAMQLRTNLGIDMSLLSAGQDSVADTLIEEGLLCRVDRNLVLTREGKALADPIAAALL